MKIKVKAVFRLSVICPSCVAEPSPSLILRPYCASKMLTKKFCGGGAGDCPEPLYVEVRMGKSFTAMISRAEVACNQGESKTFRTLNWSRANLVLAAALSLARFERFLSNFTK